MKDDRFNRQLNIKAKALIRCPRLCLHIGITLIVTYSSLGIGDGYQGSNHKKSLKIPKEKSESVNRRRTDNTMAKRKNTKGQTTINKTYI